jgi:hypothetical protein
LQCCRSAQDRFCKLRALSYPSQLSLSQARERVRAILAKQTLGITDDASPVTVQEAIDKFTASHCDVVNKPRTAQETKRLLIYLAPLARRRLVNVSTADILNIVDNASASVSEQRHVFTTARTFLRWATRQRLIKTSPLQDLRPPGLVKSRDRVLTDAEMKAIYNAATELAYPYGFNRKSRSIICSVSSPLRSRSGRQFELSCVP